MEIDLQTRGNLVPQILGGISPSQQIQDISDKKCVERLVTLPWKMSPTSKSPRAAPSTFPSREVALKFALGIDPGRINDESQAGSLLFGNDYADRKYALQRDRFPQQ